MSVGNFVVLKKIRLFISESLYFIHLPIRKLHDNTYKSSKIYKRYSDASISHAVHKATLAAFIISFFVFYSLQYLVPLLMNPLKPGEAYAGANSKTWTTKGDFENNAVSTNTATVRNGVAVSGTSSGDDASVNFSAPSFQFDTISIAIAPYHSLAVKSDGTLWAWGSDSNGQLGDGREDVSYFNTVPTKVGTGTNWKTVSAGYNMSSGIKTDGTLWVWGQYFGNVPTKVGTDTDWSQISMSSDGQGVRHVLLVKTDGTLWSFGSNGNGQLGLGNTTNVLSTPTKIGVDTDWKNIATGVAQSMAIKNNGTLWGWGSNAGYGLGLGLDQGNFLVPTQIGTETNWKTVSLVTRAGLAIKTNGTLWSWGSNFYGVLGTTCIPEYDKNSAYMGNCDENVPVQVGTDTNWATIYINGISSNAAATKSDGSLWAWGANGGVPGGAKKLVPVRVGTETDWKIVQINFNFSLGVKIDGSIWSWGGNSTYQLGLGDINLRVSPTRIGVGNDWRGVNISYSSPGTISGFKMNAGAVTKWSTITWNGTTPSNTLIKFRTKGAATEAGLVAATWSSYYSSTGSIITTSPSQWLEIELRLESTDGLNTPTVSDFTVNYDLLEAPSNANIALYRSDGTNHLKNNSGADLANGTANGWTNETSVKVTASGLTCGYTSNDSPVGSKYCATASTNRKLQVQAALTSDATFTSPISSVDAATTSTTADAGVNYSSTATLTGLTVGVYHLRARTIDSEGRASAWTSYASDGTAFTVEQTPPTLTSISVNSGAASTKNKLVNIAFSGAIDANSGLGQMRFSNNGTDWSNWEAYSATKTGWDLTQYPSNTSDGARTVYAQVRDNAGNIALVGFSNSPTLDGYTLNEDGKSTITNNISAEMTFGTDNMSWDASAFVNFNNSGMQGATSVILRLNFTGTTGTPVTIYDNGNSLDYTPVLGINNINVTSLVAADLAASRSSSNFSLADYNGSHNINSSEVANSNLRPLLTASSNFATSSIVYDTTAPVVASNSITSPNGSETWKGGSTKTITWNSAGITDAGSGLRTSTPPIKLEYTIDGTNWNLIADNEANDGTYTWTVPETLNASPLNSTTVKVRLTATDVVGNSANDVSNANFIVDSSAPTGAIGSLGQYYKTTAIDVPYIAADTANAMIETGRTGSISCHDNTQSATIENLSASLVRVNFSATSDGNSFGNGGTFTVTVFNGLTQVASFNNYSGLSGNYGLATGNKVVYTCDDFEVNEGINVNVSADFAGQQTISGVKNVKLYYTRQTAQPYTWTAYPNNSTPATFTSTPISFDTAQIADATKTGNYGFKLVVEDNAGNVSATPISTTAPDSATFIDVNAPTGTLSINSGAVATNDINNASLSFTLSDVGSGLASYQIDNNDGNWLPATPVDISAQTSPYSGTFTGWHLLPSDGLKTVRIKLLDKAGNEVTNITDTIAVDNTPPKSIDAVVAKNGDNLSETLSSSGVSQGWYPYSNFNFYIKAVDEQSGIKEFKYCFVKAAETCDYSANPAVAASQVGSTTSYEANKSIALADDRQGVLTLKVKGVDFVGLESSEVTYVYKFDKIKPGAVMNFRASKGTELTTVKLIWDDPSTSATTAPSQKFKIERILAESYTPSLGYDGVWGGLASFNEQTLDVVADAAVLTKVGNTFTFHDQTMQNSLKYLYRISAKDYSNFDFGGYPVDDPEFVENGYGYTRDVAAPEVYPSGVVATACNSNLSGGVCDGINKKGHQVQVKWLPAEDSGAGVAGYEIYRREGGSAEPNGWIQIEANFAETSDALNVYRVFYDNTVVDAKSYSYRVVAFDNIPAELGSPNKTDLFRGNDYTNLDNATTTPANVPDVTPPTVPASFSATPMGIDYILDELGEYHQKISSAWKQTTDNNLLTNITYQLYFSQTNTPESFTVVDTQNSAPFNTASQQESERISYKFDQTGLADKTTFYYYLKVTDSLGNSAVSSIKSATTGNSQAPTPPTGVEVHNDTVGIDAGTQLTVKFRGSLAKNCDEGTKADCIASYETYRAETNTATDIDGSLTPSDSTDNCNLGETPDDCWIRINNATLANTQTPNPPVANETLAAKRTFLATGLVQATKYYFRVRALDNNTDEPLSSPLSTVYEDQIHTGGWDITRDLTSPALPGTGLEVKVKDTHPNTSVLRNIISWKILEETPLRKKQSYEKSVENGGSCTIVNSGGTDYCKDFGRYEIYRQILDVNNNIIYESETPIATITDPETNLYIDSIGNNDVLEGVTGTPKIIDTKIRYYVQVVDNSYDAFLYENGSKINTAPNKSEKQYSTDTIIPSKATPSVVGSVNLSDVAVTSAIVSWNTDQDTDSLVQYRISGSSSDWVTVGQVERRPNHSVKLFGLVPNTTYEYKLVSRNYLDNRATYNESSLPILKTGGFNIVEGSVSTVTTTTGVEIKWSTNLDASSSFVEYQMQTQPGDEPQGKTVGVNPSDILASPRNHKVTFNGLKSNRTYYFKIKSLSRDGFVAEYPVYDEVNKKNLDTFATQSFDTSQFTITPSSSNVAEKNITSTTALIAWSTGVPTTSWVDFSPNHITKENKTISSAGNNDLNTQHAVQIEGLIPGTKYYYVVRSKNANDIEFTSPEYSFTAILKPKILDFKIMEVKPYQISVAWTTNVDTETIVNWGKTTAYGEKRGKNEQTQNHLLTIDQLEDNTEYHLQIVAHDETGAEVVDADKIIKTPLDTQGPKIESVKTDILPMGASDETGSVIISWNTDKPATTKIEYDEGIIAGRYNMSSIEDTTLNLSHTVIIKNLKPAASYHYRIAIKDKRNNQTISQDYTFVTPSKEKSILQLILKSLEETFSWTKNMNKFFGNVGKRVTGK